MFAVRALAFLMLILLVPGSLNAADVPDLLNLQGHLRNSAGEAITGTVKLDIRLYDAKTGGTTLFSETLSSVSVTSGRFKVLIGETASIPSTVFRDNAAVYMGLQVDDGAELTRRRLTSVAYSHSSRRAVSSDSSSDVACSGCVKMSELAADVSSTFVDVAGDTVTGPLVLQGAVTAQGAVTFGGTATFNGVADFAHGEIRNARFHNTATAPASCSGSTKGYVYFNTADQKLHICNGSEWFMLATAAPPDEDSDGVGNLSDNCLLIANADQLDTDSDGKGDACDTDDDGDGVADISDNCPLVANADQTDTDSDGSGDACDTDADNDGVVDLSDNCPLVANVSQTDTDSDGSGDACDSDDDGDGEADGSDCAPLDDTVYPGASESCNSVDDDCDGSTDEGIGNSGCTTYYKDVDGDTYGQTADTRCLCSADAGLDYDATAGGDCNDLNASVSPGAT